MAERLTSEGKNGPMMEYAALTKRYISQRITVAIIFFQFQSPQRLPSPDVSPTCTLSSGLLSELGS